MLVVLIGGSMVNTLNIDVLKAEIGVGGNYTAWQVDRRRGIHSFTFILGFFHAFTDIHPFPLHKKLCNCTEFWST